MLLGNKEDMAKDTSRKVTTQEGHKLAEHHQAEFYECSARNGYNIERLMSELARMLVAQQDRQCNDTLTLTENTAKISCC
ncbi:unnamed protein product [Boreogadus saida]